jgi:hypothetical protein
MRGGAENEEDFDGPRLSSSSPSLLVSVFVTYPRMALRGEVRAARTAGSRPPKRPIPQAKTRAVVSTRGVASNEKTISDQLDMFTIEK